MRTVPCRDPRVTRWLYLVASITCCLIVFGGVVRLTRSGLSIVEWNPVWGVLPPMTEQAWQSEFAKYQDTPEFQTVNYDMTLAAYRRIFYMEWAHRLIARIAGLAVVGPLVVFLLRGVIPLRQSGLFIGVALLFGMQGFLGWFMVQSGLLDRPSVSHYRLTIHLLTALLLVSTTIWAAMNRSTPAGAAMSRLGHGRAGRRAVVLLAAVTIQIAFGGLVAGLKAGHVSYSWPLMGGAFLPSGLFSGAESWWAAITASPAAVHWIHRWFAVAVCLAAGALLASGRDAAVTPASRRAIHLAAALVGVQVLLGISVIWWHVPIVLALSHQAVGLGVFTTTIVACHRLRCDAGVPTSNARTAATMASAPPGSA